jgi:hypothetical protein
MVPGLLALERWQWFDSWTKRVSGAGLFDTAVVLGTSPQWEICHWRNDSGASIGTAEYRWPLSAISMTSSVELENQHTVHLRLQNQSNDGDSPQVGPATCVHDGGSGQPGNCYYAFARYSGGTRYIGIGKLSSGSKSTLAEATAPIEMGDALSLGYQWDVSAGAAQLTAMVSGAAVTSATDTGGYRMGSLSALPGVVGLDTLSISNMRQHGAAWSEWWVTDLSGSWGELKELAGDLTATPIVQLLSYQRYAGDPEPRVKWAFSGEIIKLQWTHKRNGGCGRAKIELQPQAWNTGLLGLYPVDGGSSELSTRTFEEPFADDWEANDWHGGDVTISVRYSGRKLTTTDIVEDTLYRGRISKVEVDGKSGAVRIECDGLISTMEDFFVWYDKRKSITIREAIESTIEGSLVKSATHDGALAGHNILGLQSFLDQKVDMDYEVESVRSVIDELVALLPDGMVYGVDAQGVFYVQQQNDHYTTDISSSAQLPIVTFDARTALSYKRSIDFRKLRTTVTVYGAEDESESRVAGGSAAVKALALYGRRHKVKTQDSIGDAGLAAKYAQAILKRVVAPKLSVGMKVQQPILDSQAFWTTLTPFMPVVAIRDRRDDNMMRTFDPSSSSRYVSDQLLRRFGDLAGWSTAEKGTAGGSASWPSTSREQALQKSWLFHARIRFDAAHPAAGFHAFVCGRPRGGAGNSRKGWGGLYWNGTTGNLEWWGEDSVGALYVIQTGLTVSTSTPAGATVDLFVHRAADGSWSFFNGGAAAGSDSSAAAKAIVLGTGSWDWRLFDAAGSGDYGFDGTIDNVYLIDSAPRTEGDQTLGVEAQRFGMAGFASRNAGAPLKRNDSYGLLMLAKLNEPTDPDVGADGEMVVWTDDGSSSPTKRIVTWTAGTGSSQSGSITLDSRRGYRLGEGAKRWGGPLVLYVAEVKYTVEPSSGLVTREMTLGSEQRSFAQSLANLEREVSRQSEILNRTD